MKLIQVLHSVHKIQHLPCEVSLLSALMGEWLQVLQCQYKLNTKNILLLHLLPSPPLPRKTDAHFCRTVSEWWQTIQEKDGPKPFSSLLFPVQTYWKDRPTRWIHLFGNPVTLYFSTAIICLQNLMPVIQLEQKKGELMVPNAAHWLRLWHVGMRWETRLQAVLGNLCEISLLILGEATHKLMLATSAHGWLL